MKHEDIDADLQELAFLFFYKYSRFEFALKENGYLRDRDPGSPAIPGWREFASARYAAYCLSPEVVCRSDPQRRSLGPGFRPS